MTSEQIIQNAYYVPDIEAGITRFHALWGVGPFFEGRGATYLDTFELLGHATEVYIVNDSLKKLYVDVRHASETWDGKELVREL